MRNTFRAFTIVSLIAVEVGTGRAAMRSGKSACGSIKGPAAASERLNELATYDPAAGGASVTAFRWDPVLRQRWVAVTSCDHPERPAFARHTTQLNFDTPPLQERGEVHDENLRNARPIVRAGEVVRLWRQEEHLRIEVVAVAVESGGLGSHIQVHLVNANPGDQQQVQRLNGVIRGPSDVEMR